MDKECASQIYDIVANFAKSSVISGELHPFFDRYGENLNYTIYFCFNKRWSPLCSYLKGLTYEEPKKNDINLDISVEEWLIEQFPYWKRDKNRLRLIEEELKRFGGI